VVEQDFGALEIGERARLVDPPVAQYRPVARVEIQAEHGSFDGYLWGFVGGEPKVNRRENLSELPASTAESDALSKDLKKRGFNFVGTTICYAFMQAIGMVNDHEVGCFRYAELVGGKI